MITVALQQCEIRTPAAGCAHRRNKPRQHRDQSGSDYQSDLCWCQPTALNSKCISTEKKYRDSILGAQSETKATYRCTCRQPMPIVSALPKTTNCQYDERDTRHVAQCYVAQEPVAGKRHHDYRRQQPC